MAVKTGTLGRSKEETLAPLKCSELENILDNKKKENQNEHRKD